jgi:hypothetical protein
MAMTKSPGPFDFNVLPEQRRKREAEAIATGLGVSTCSPLIICTAV